MAKARLVETFGPNLSRPHVDTLKGSRHPNMKALDMTQTALAEELKIGQDTVSRLERRTDMLLSTLSEYVNALGGRLELNVEFPGHKKVRLKSLHELKDSNEEAA